MTMFHLSPKTGKTERCRAKKKCWYGQTSGQTTLKDGTTLTGTEGEDVEFVGHNPTQRPTTKKPYGLRKKKTDETTESTNTDSTTVSETSSTDSTATTYDQDEMDRQTAAMGIGGWSHRGKLEGDSIEEFARRAAIPRQQREQLHEEKKARIEAGKKKREAEEKKQEERDRKKDERAAQPKKKLSKKQKKQLSKQREKERWAKLSRAEKLKEIAGWKDSKNTNQQGSGKKKSSQKQPSMIDNIDSWIEEQQRRGSTSEEAIDMLLSGKSF